MHIPASMLHGAVCPVTAAVSSTGLAGAAVAAYKAENKPGRMKFAAVSALIFAAQMLNFPVSQGTSGHFIGGMFACLALGVPFGILAMSLVLAVQCLFFGDGGLDALGANILNMALIGGAAAWIFGTAKSHSKIAAAKAGIGSWLAVLAGAAACSFELAASGTVPLKAVLSAMLGVHLIIGTGEALLTALLFQALIGAKSAKISGRTQAITALGAAIAGILMSPFASRFPDGLTMVSERLDFAAGDAAAFVLFPAIQAVPGILAGMIGLITVFAAAFLTAGLFARSRAAVSR